MIVNSLISIRLLRNSPLKEVELFKIDIRNLYWRVVVDQLHVVLITHCVVVLVVP